MTILHERKHARSAQMRPRGKCGQLLARVALDLAEQRADGLLVGGNAVEVAHQLFILIKDLTNRSLI